MRQSTRIILVVIFLLFLLPSCKKEELVEQDLVGTWKSSDGAELTLNEDNTFVMKKINLSNVFLDKNRKDSIVNFTGNWKLTVENYSKEVVKINNDNYSFIFEISGQGIFENRSPWTLFIWIGDPDEMLKYEFFK